MDQQIQEILNFYPDKLSRMVNVKVSRGSTFANETFCKFHKINISE